MLCVGQQPCMVSLLSAIYDTSEKWNSPVQYIVLFPTQHSPAILLWATFSPAIKWQADVGLGMRPSSVQGGGGGLDHDCVYYIACMHSM